MSQNKLPQYRCHKVVGALKIKDIQRAPSGNATVAYFVIPEESGFLPFALDPKAIARYMPRPGDYYVMYEDGYTSLSPAKAFEDGYTLIEESVPPKPEQPGPQCNYDVFNSRMEIWSEIMHATCGASMYTTPNAAKGAAQTAVEIEKTLRAL